MGTYPLPVVLLARLAVATEDQGRGLGAGLLKDAVQRTLRIAEYADRCPVRLPGGPSAARAHG